MPAVVIDLEVTRFAELRRRLVEADPDIDERTLSDTLDGATSLKEAIGGIIRMAFDRVLKLT